MTTLPTEGHGSYGSTERGGRIGFSNQLALNRLEMERVSYGEHACRFKNGKQCQLVSLHTHNYIELHITINCKLSYVLIFLLNFSSISTFAHSLAHRLAFRGIANSNRLDQTKAAVNITYTHTHLFLLITQPPFVHTVCI